jgi:hypothetical protein
MPPPPNDPALRSILACAADIFAAAAGPGVCANFVGADAFSLVAGLVWLCDHIQMETCWSALHPEAAPLPGSPSGLSCASRYRPSEQAHDEDDLGYLQI